MYVNNIFFINIDKVHKGVQRTVQSLQENDQDKNRILDSVDDLQKDLGIKDVQLAAIKANVNVLERQVESQKVTEAEKIIENKNLKQCLYSLRSTTSDIDQGLKNEADMWQQHYEK